MAQCSLFFSHLCFKESAKHRNPKHWSKLSSPLWSVSSHSAFSWKNFYQPDPCTHSSLNLFHSILLFVRSLLLLQLSWNLVCFLLLFIFLYCLFSPVFLWCSLFSLPVHDIGGCGTYVRTDVYKPVEASFPPFTGCVLYYCTTYQWCAIEGGRYLTCHHVNKNVKWK